MTTTAATNTNAQEALSAQKAAILCDLDAIQTATERYVAARQVEYETGPRICRPLSER